MKCDGDGRCLSQTDDIEVYERSSDCMYNCSPQKCPNFELCNTTGPKYYFLCHEGYCTGCHISFGNKTLEIRDTTESCVICFDTKGRELKFPAGCEHWFCIPCSRDMIFWDETRHTLSPVPYGCPPCPKGCDNPITGQQCYCEEYYGDETEENPCVIEKWRREYPNQYKRWNDEERVSMETIIGTFANRRCPLCRKYLPDNPWELSR